MRRTPAMVRSTSPTANAGSTTSFHRGKSKLSPNFAAPAADSARLCGIRNPLLGQGVATHHASAHLVSVASGGQRVLSLSPNLRRDPMRSSEPSFLHHDDQAPIATHVTGWAEAAQAIRPAVGHPPANAVHSIVSALFLLRLTGVGGGAQSTTSGRRPQSGGPSDRHGGDRPF